MENRVSLGNTIMARWMEKHSELCELNPQRFLYIHNGTEEMHIIETNTNYDKSHGIPPKVLVYEYDCGELYNIRSENNTFIKYLMMVMVAENAEYLDRTDR